MRGSVFLAVVLWAGAAHANLAAVRMHPAGLAAPSFEEGSPLRVTGERLALDCDEVDGRLHCRLEAVYDVVNPGGEEVRVAGAFFGVQTRELVITAAGRDVSRALTAEEEARLAKVLARLEAERRESHPAPWGLDGSPDRFGFELQVPPGGKVELVARGRVEPEERFVPRGYSLPAVESRHLLLGRAGRARSWDLRYLLAPIWAWQGDPRVEITLRTPSGIALVDRDWAVSREAGRRVARKHLLARDAPGTLYLPLTAEPSTLEPGGLVLGIGGFWGDESGLRLRAGYEAGAMGWLLGSLVAETDVQRRLQLVPALEAALPAVLFLPSLGLGLGVPVEVLPEVRAAARLQASAMFFPVGVLFTVDLFPRAGASPARWEFALLFQASL